MVLDVRSPRRRRRSAGVAAATAPAPPSPRALGCGGRQPSCFRWWCAPRTRPRDASGARGSPPGATGAAAAAAAARPPDGSRRVSPTRRRPGRRQTPQPTRSPRQCPTGSGRQRWRERASPNGSMRARPTQCSRLIGAGACFVALVCYQVANRHAKLAPWLVALAAGNPSRKQQDKKGTPRESILGPHQNTYGSESTSSHPYLRRLTLPVLAPPHGLGRLTSRAPQGPPSCHRRRRSR